MSQKRNNIEKQHNGNAVKKTKTEYCDAFEELILNAFKAYKNKDIIRYNECMMKIESLPCQMTCQMMSHGLHEHKKNREMYRYEIENLMEDHMVHGIIALNNGLLDEYNDKMDKFEELVKFYADFPNDDEFDKSEHGSINLLHVCESIDSLHMHGFINALCEYHEIKTKIH